MLATGLSESDGTYEAEKKTGTPTEGDSGTENNDSGNLKTIADNTKKITENQTVQANKTDVSNTHLSDISGKMDNLSAKIGQGVTKDQMSEVLTAAFSDYVGTTANTDDLEQIETGNNNAYSSMLSDLNTENTLTMIPEEYREKTDIEQEMGTILEGSQSQAKNIADKIAATSVTYSSPECELVFPYKDKDLKFTMCAFGPQLENWGNIIKSICVLHALIIVFRRR